MTQILPFQFLLLLTGKYFTCFQTLLRRKGGKQSPHKNCLVLLGKIQSNVSSKSKNSFLAQSFEYVPNLESQNIGGQGEEEDDDLKGQRHASF